MSRKKSDDLVDQKLIHGLGHPLRVRCLALLCDKTWSPRQLSDELGEGLSQVSYHIKVLRKTGLVEPAGTRPARGATEHFYRSVHPLVIPEGLWSRLPRAARRKIVGDVLKDIDDDVTTSIKAGTFDAREDFHVSWTPMQLDDEGCKELAARTDRFMAELVEVQAQSSQRLAGGPGETTPTSAAILIFGSARGTNDDTKASARRHG